MYSQIVAFEQLADIHNILKHYFSPLFLLGIDVARLLMYNIIIGKIYCTKGIDFVAETSAAMRADSNGRAKAEQIPRTTRLFTQKEVFNYDFY